MPELSARLEQLDTIFSVELSERVQTLSELLAEVERGADPGAPRSIARALHSLKGAARAVDATAIEQVAHAAEAATLSLDGQPDAAWVGALRMAIDALKALHSEPGADVSSSIARLVAVTRVEAEPAPRALAGPLQPPVAQRQPAERNELRDLQRQIERWQRDWSKTRPARARLNRAGHRTRESETLIRAADLADRQMQAVLQRTRELVADLAQNTAQLATVATGIGQEVMAIRLLPAGSIFQPLERLVRDLARQTGKEVRLELSGTDTEVDRRILDELRDPLMHMMRNSVDHGIELPDERRQEGKPGQGRLTLSAFQRGDRVLIVVGDDGRGLDIDAIRATAIRRNLLTLERAESIDTAALVDLIFHPGFSTRDSVTEISGRGVGMDVVRDNVRRLGGEVRVQTTPGAGTTFTITVPLTLATTRVLLVENAGLTYAVPSSNVERTGRIRATELHRVEGRLGLKIDGRVVPVVELSGVLKQPASPDAPESTEEWRPFFVLIQGDRAVALLTDRLVDETELVVKALGAPLKRVRHVSGAAVLGTGSVVVILNPSDLFNSAVGNMETAPRASASDPSKTSAARRRVLIVDDSVMTRTLERTILEGAGYSVAVAADGVQALELLNESDFDVVVSDVEMPRMTGVELTIALREDERWRHLPVVLVTSLDAPEHVERGAAAGADAYIVKGRFDQNDLLQTVARLV